jgi:hypothetical protein
VVVTHHLHLPPLQQQEVGAVLAQLHSHLATHGMVLLLGPSGAGKSVALRVLAAAYDQLAVEGALPLPGGPSTTFSSNNGSQEQPRMVLVTAFPDAWHVPSHGSKEGHIPHQAAGSPLVQLLRHHCQAALRAAHGVGVGAAGGEEQEEEDQEELQGLDPEEGEQQDMDWAAGAGLTGSGAMASGAAGTPWLLVLDGPLGQGSVTEQLLQQLLLGWPLGTAVGVWLQQAWGLPPGCCGVVVESGGTSAADLPPWLVPAAPAVVLRQALVAHALLLQQRLAAALAAVQVLPVWPSDDGCSCCGRQRSSSTSGDNRQDQQLVLEVPPDLQRTLLGLLQDLAAVAAQQHQHPPGSAASTRGNPASNTGTSHHHQDSTGSGNHPRPGDLAAQCSQAALLSDVLAVAGAMWRATDPTTPAAVARLAPRVVLAAATWLLAGCASATSATALATLQQAWAGVCAGAGLGEALPPQGQLLQHCLCLGCGEWRGWGEATQQWGVLGGAVALKAQGEDPREAWDMWAGSGTEGSPVLVDTPVGLLVVSQRGAALHHCAWWGMAAGRRLLLTPAPRSAEQATNHAPSPPPASTGAGCVVEGCTSGPRGGLSSPDTWVSAATLALQLTTGRPVPHAPTTAGAAVAAAAAAASAGGGIGSAVSASQQRLLSRLTRIDPGVLRLLPPGAGPASGHSPRGHASCLGPAPGAAGKQGGWGAASAAIVDEAGVLLGLVEDALSRLPTVSSLSPDQLKAALLGLYSSLAAAAGVTGALAAMGQLEPAAKEALVVGRLVEGHLEPATGPLAHAARGTGGRSFVERPAGAPAALSQAPPQQQQVCVVPPLTPQLYGRLLSVAVSSVTAWRADPACPAAGRAWLRWDELALALVDAAVGAWLEGGAATAAGLGLAGLCHQQPVLPPLGAPASGAAPALGRSTTSKVQAPSSSSSSSSSPAPMWPGWWLGFRNIVVLLVTSALSSAVTAARGGGMAAPLPSSSSPPPGGNAQSPSPLAPLKPHYQRALAASISRRGDRGGVELSAATWLLLLEAHGAEAVAALRALLQGGATSRALHQLVGVAALGRDALLSWEPLQVGVARQELVGLLGAGVEAALVAAGVTLGPAAPPAWPQRQNIHSSRGGSRRSTAYSWRATGEEVGPQPRLSASQLQRLCQLLPWDAWVSALTRLMWRLEGGGAACDLLGTGAAGGGGVGVPGPGSPSAAGAGGVPAPWGAAAARHASVGGAPEPLVRPMSRMAAGPAAVTVLLGGSSWDRQCAAALAAAAMCAPLVPLSPATASTWGDLLLLLAGALTEQATGPGSQQLVVLLVGPACCHCPAVLHQLQRLATRGLTSRPTQLSPLSPGSPAACGVALEHAASLAIHVLVDVGDAAQAAAVAAAAPELWAAAGSWVAPPVAPATAQQDMGAALLREAQPLVLALHAAQQEAAGTSPSPPLAGSGAARSSRSPSPTRVQRLGRPRSPLGRRLGGKEGTSSGVQLSTPELQQLACQLATALLDMHTAAGLVCSTAAPGCPPGGGLAPGWHHLQHMMVLAPACYAAARRPLLLQRRQLAQALEALQQLEAGPTSASSSSGDSGVASEQGVDTHALLAQLRDSCSPQVPAWCRQLAEVEAALGGLVPLALVAAAQQVLLPLVLAALGAAGVAQEQAAAATQQLMRDWRQAALRALSLGAARLPPAVACTTTWGTRAPQAGTSWWHRGCPSAGELLGVSPPAAAAMAAAGLTGVTPGAEAAAAAVAGGYLTAVAACGPVLVADPLQQLLPLLLPHPLVQQVAALQAAPDGGRAATPAVVTQAGQRWMLLSAGAISQHLQAAAASAATTSSCSPGEVGGAATTSARALLRVLQPHLESGGAVVVVVLSGDTEADAAAAATLAALHWLLNVAGRLAAVADAAAQEQVEEAPASSSHPDRMFSGPLGEEAEEGGGSPQGDPAMAAMEAVLLSAPPPAAACAAGVGPGGGVAAAAPRLLLVAPRESYSQLVAAPRLHEVATCVPTWQWLAAAPRPPSQASAGAAAGPQGRPQPQALSAALGEPLVAEAAAAAVLAAAQPTTRKRLERVAAAAAAAAEALAAEEQQLLQRLAQVSLAAERGSGPAPGPVQGLCST